MFIVSVCLGQSAQSPQFMFKELISAKAFRDRINEARAHTLEEDAKPGDDWLCDMRDDYGHTLDVHLDDIAGIILKDVAQSLKASADLAMLNTRAQAELSAKVQSDPKLRFLAGGVGLGNANG